jgi:hypothetical protein
MSIDLLMVVIYIVLGMLFINSKGKGCNFITGYNMKAPEERRNYDEVGICNYFGKTILLWSVFFVVGAIVDYLYAGVGIALAFLALLIDMVYFIFYIRVKKFDEKFKIAK